MKSIVCIILILTSSIRHICAQSAGAGKVDLSFIQSNNLAMKPNSGVLAIGVQTNGQVLIGGGFTQPLNDWGLARMNENGAPDGSFGASVQQYNPFGSLALGGRVTRIMRRADGRFFISGLFHGVGFVGGYTNLALLDATGRHDTNYVASGLDPSLLSGQRMAVTADNKVLVNIHSNLVYRLSHTGAVEASMLLSNVQQVQTIAAAPDGGFFVSAMISNVIPFRVTVFRFDSNGVPDVNFSAPDFDLAAGTAAAQLGLPLVLPDGKPIVLGFFALVGGVQRGGVARLNLNGSLDTSFVPGANGVGTIYQGNLIGIDGISLLPDGRFVIFRQGPFRYNGVYRNGIARISSTGALDTSFDPGVGPQSYNPGIQSTEGWGIQTATPSDDGRVYVGGTFTNFNNTGRQYLVRLNSGPVSSTPTILTPPASQSVSNGANVTFSVVASGPGTLTYVWRQNTKVITGAIGATLTVTNVDLQDVGVYSVTVANSAGSVIATPAILTVNGVSVPDFKGPSFKVTSPSGFFFQVPSNHYDFRGTAKDDHGLGVLVYKQNANAWVQIGLTTNWSFGVTLDPGSNVFLVTVADTSGNYAPTQRIVVFYAVTQFLNLTIVGNGNVSGATNGQGLAVARNYTLKATPATGNLFSNWVADGFILASNSISYFMKTNGAVLANFITNPFIALQGNYNGLFYETNNPAHESSGYFNFKSTSAGGYSLKLVHAGISYTASGTFDLALHSKKSIARKLPLGPLTVDLQLMRDTDQVTGIVTDGHWSSELAGYRAVFTAANPATNNSGSYTMLISGNEDPTVSPLGQSFSTVAITTLGGVTFKGVFGENTILAAKSTLAQNGQCPVYVPLYKNAGSFFGWVTFMDTITNDVHGPFLWTKPSGVFGSLYSGGFTGNVVALGSRYVAPANGDRIVGLTNGHVIVAGGNLPNAVTNTFALDSANKFKITSTNLPSLVLKVTTSSGLLAGTFIHPATLKSAAIKGVILQKQVGGGGFYTGTNLTGKVYLGDPASTPFFDE